MYLIGQCFELEYFIQYLKDPRRENILFNYLLFDFAKLTSVPSLETKEDKVL